MNQRQLANGIRRPVVGIRGSEASAFWSTVQNPLVALLLLLLLLLLPVLALTRGDYFFLGGVRGQCCAVAVRVDQLGTRRSAIPVFCGPRTFTGRDRAVSLPYGHDGFVRTRGRGSATGSSRCRPLRTCVPRFVDCHSGFKGVQPRGCLGPPPRLAVGHPFRGSYGSATHCV